jgi:probable phosphoglycerate mutase
VSAAGAEGAPARRLVLLRHGRTAWNAVGRAQGHADIELDDLGHQQAAAAAPYVAAMGLSALWSSDLIRARRTAEYVAAASGLQVKHDERLREFDVGQRQGLTLAEFAERHPDEYAQRLQPDMPSVAGGESGADVLSRMVPALREFLEALEPGETGLAVTHGAAVKVGLAGLLGWGVEESFTFGVLENCGWATVESRPGSDRIRLLGYNEKAPG